MPAMMPRAEQIEKLRGQLGEAMARIEERGQLYSRLSAMVLVERSDHQLGLILIGAGGVEDVSRLLINPLEIYWPELLTRDRGGEGGFLGMEVLPLWLGSNGVYTPETIKRIEAFVGSDGRIVHIAGYDYSLAEELSPPYQAARKEVKTWFGQDLDGMVSEMRQITNEDYEEACASKASDVHAGEGGFADAYLRSFVSFATDYYDYWSDGLKQLYEFVRSGLVGRSGHPREEEVFRLAMGDDVDGNRPFEIALESKAELDKVRFHELRREIIGGLRYDLLTLLAPEKIRRLMMSDCLMMSDNLRGQEMVMENILWYEAIRKLILEFHAQSRSKD